MRRPRPPRDPQRGNSLLLALIVMSALATLGSLTVVSMQSSIQMSTNNRAQEIALYAAESGAAVTMDFLRRTFDASGGISTSWGNYCTANNAAPLVPMAPFILSSDALPGDLANHNLFSADQQAWYHIDILNNPDDQGFATGTGTCDTDGILIIRSTGHGPQGSVAIVEWEVQRVGFWGHDPPAPTGFALRNGTGAPPSVPWYRSTPLPWVDNWTPLPFATFAPPSFPAAGVVLLGWHIVSL